MLLRRRALKLLVIVASALSVASCMHRGSGRSVPKITAVEVGGAHLYAREIGQGEPLIIVHGGPDFDHRYLLPELDAWADEFRLIYYDQRGRGLSAEGVNPEDVTLSSDLSDLDKIRRNFGLEAPVLVGHSWGAVLALEYALRYPQSISGLILMNPAPASAADLALFRSAYRTKLGSDLERQNQIAAGDAYRSGDPAAVTARYRIHFRPAVHDEVQYDKLMRRMESAFHHQGASGILKARRVEDRLMEDTWQIEGYDLLPKLRRLHVRALVITGDQDFIPVEVSRNIATAMPNASFVSLKNCGHFSYMECPDQLRTELKKFMQD